METVITGSLKTQVKWLSRVENNDFKIVSWVKLKIARNDFSLIIIIIAYE